MVKRLIRKIIRVLELPIRYAAYAALSLLAEKRKVGSLRVMEMTFGERDTAVERLQRVADALVLIRRHDEPRWRRAQRDLKRIIISDSIATQHWEYLAACVLNGRQVDAYEQCHIAMMVVHEATHARLHASGVSRLHFDEERREREDGVCIRQEIAFARKLPVSHELIRWAEERLQRSVASEAQREEYREDALRQLGWPSWLIRLRRRLID